MRKLRDQRVGSALTSLVIGGLMGCHSADSAVEPSSGLAEFRKLAEPGCAAGSGAGRIVVDASRDGGVWWFPQAAGFSPNDPHQGKALADYLRSRGFEVDELGRGTILTAAIFRGARVVIRANNAGSYTPAELAAYSHFLSCPSTLVLLADSPRPDQLAQLLDLTYAGTGFGTLTEFASHPLTQGVTGISFLHGTTLGPDYPPTTRVLAWFEGRPAMALLAGYAARILFLGEMNGLEEVPQPFVDNMIAWGF